MKPTWANVEKVMQAKDAEIDRLQESVNYLQIADNHHQELMAEKEEEITRLRAMLEWLNQKGGLGLDVHERIAKALAKEGK